MQTGSSGTQADPRGEEVVAWRRRQLLSAGFPPGLAGALAEASSFDLHALLQLVERGCPPVLAARILAPADGEGGSR
ncbi:hypothetical protein [Geodermatophilus chilensis]|jgi:hypothetical protein|uniref:hypothetical protein n=1 Tax=Geodermatophilus chilensis TaxID=2035835 RepID=UPI000C268714|nr:hypothetical protein [Geodermatophilus chilensis]